MRYGPATLLMAILISATSVVLADKATSKAHEDSSSPDLGLWSSAMYDEMLEQVWQQLLPKLHPPRGQKGPADKREAFKAAVREAYPYAEVRAAGNEIYGRHFTKTERAELAAFFNSPTGLKYNRLASTLRAEHGALMGAVVQKRLPAALEKRGLELDD
jgi:hypothetical protein